MSSDINNAYAKVQNKYAWRDGKAMWKPIYQTNVKVEPTIKDASVEESTYLKLNFTSLPTQDAAIGPKHGKSKMSTQGEEAIIVTFRKHILLPLDNCLYSLRAIIPCLTRSSLHHCLQRHGISILSDVEGEIKAKKKFKLCPIGYFHIDIAEVITEEGKLQLNLLMLNCIITL
ncbi:Hypothetical protein CINCED_3A003651 [Cinara cedri]|uniref:Uncharacterized protein n=1 Tax=Cinara cedri TaxID=506608 RepID=A0A5E4MU91_9HEMI|nr:Hypothetical protein CINCED_3A003651 [Cinara cedri]